MECPNRYAATENSTGMKMRLFQSKILVRTGRFPCRRNGRSRPTPPRASTRLVDAAYEKQSIGISSNLHPGSFDELMPKTLATVTIDRLLHHAHLCQTSRDSVRLTQALAGKGVTPLK